MTEIQEVLKESKSHGEVLARLDERSLNQEKRMDRIDRRSIGFGGTAGGIVALVISTALKAIGWPSA